MKLFGELSAQRSILNATLKGTAARNEVITNNIANADVPGFRARELAFEDHLIDLIGESSGPVKRINSNDFTPTISYRNPGMVFRTDGNNVDIDTEMVNLYQNQMRFETVISSVMANSQRMRTILSPGGGA